MSEPRRKLSISVPELPWMRREREAEEARHARPRYMPVKPLKDEAHSPTFKAMADAELKAIAKQHRWAGTD